MSKSSLALLISFSSLGILYSFEDHPRANEKTDANHKAGGDQKSGEDQKKPVCAIRECDPKAPLVAEVLKVAECCPDLPFNTKLVFTEPVHFPDPRFGEPIGGNARGITESLFSRCPNNQMRLGGIGPTSTFAVFQSGDPLIIHEGMVLWVNNDGRYRITMKVTAPDTAIDLRMQLQLHKASAMVNNDLSIKKVKTKTFEINEEGKIKDQLREAEGIKTLSLPPIYLSPRPIEPIALEKPFKELNRTGTSRTFLVVVEDQSYLFEKMVISPGNPGFSLLRQGTARFGSPVPR